MPKRAPGEPSAARLVAREARLVDEENAHPGACEVDRRGRPCRPGTDDEHVEALHPAIVGRAASRGYNCAPPQGFPSGQRGRAVNPLAQPSEVRILPPASGARSESASADSDRAKTPEGVRSRGRGAATGLVWRVSKLSDLALLAQLVEHLHGKEGVDGSSPSEGLAERPASRGLFLSERGLRRVCLGRIGLTSGEPRRGERSPRDCRRQDRSPTPSRPLRRWSLLRYDHRIRGKRLMYRELTLGRRRPGGVTPHLSSIDDEIASPKEIRDPPARHADNSVV